MKIIGIVAEYNPFHNGHLYQINQTKAALNPDGVVAIMSGNFVQRGMPAFYNKWLRTEAAIASGVNLVLELPTYYATASAETFAHGAINLLHQTGIVTHLSFGSESDDLETFKKIAHVLANEPPHYKEALKDELAKGQSFPKAREKALQTLLGIDSDLNKPNAILAIEYLKSLQRCNAPIEPFVVKRMGSGYHDRELNTTLASATAIRAAYSETQSFDNLKQFMPEPSWSIYRHAPESAAQSNLYELLLLYKLRTLRPEMLQQYRDYSEGIENKVLSAAKLATDYTGLVSDIKSKRYAETRVNRLLLSAFLDLPKTPFNLSTEGYLRVLGMDATGQKMLKQMKKTATCPIITNINQVDRQVKQNPLLAIDLKAADLYRLLQKDIHFRSGGQDLLKNVIRK